MTTTELTSIAACSLDAGAAAQRAADLRALLGPRLRRLGTGLLLAGACGACWVAPLLIATLGAGWAGALGAGWTWIAATAVAAAAGAVAVRRFRRGRAAGCAPASAPARATR